MGVEYGITSLTLKDHDWVTIHVSLTLNRTRRRCYILKGVVSRWAWPEPKVTLLKTSGQRNPVQQSQVGVR